MDYLYLTCVVLHQSIYVQLLNVSICSFVFFEISWHNETIAGMKLRSVYDMVHIYPNNVGFLCRIYI